MDSSLNMSGFRQGRNSRQTPCLPSLKFVLAEKQTRLVLLGTRGGQTLLLQALKQSRKRGGNAEVAEDKDY